jgi:hypothetical protein
MATFQDRITQLIGDDTIGVGNTVWVEFLNQTLKDVATEIVFMLPDKYLWKVSKKSDVLSNNDNTALEEDTSKILRVYREANATKKYIICKLALDELQFRLEDVNSLFFATKETPYYTLSNNDLNIYPEPSNPNNQAFYEYVAKPILEAEDTTIPEGVGSPPNFPDEIIPAIIYGTCVKALQRRLNYYIQGGAGEDLDIAQAIGTEYGWMKEQYDRALAPYIGGVGEESA